MIQGSSHPRTARNATGQEICGRTPVCALIFFPRRHLIGSHVGWRNGSLLRWLRSPLHHACRSVAGMIPTEREGAAHQLPMPSDRLVTPDLVLGPAQGVVDLLVTLLDPQA